MRSEEYFSIIPEYVLDAEVSDGAYRLYGALAREVNTGTKVGFARLKDVAARLRKSESSVRRHLDELVKAGLLVSQPQWTNDKGNFSTKYTPGWRQTMNMYTLKRANPPSRDDRGTYPSVTDVVKSPEAKSPISYTSDASASDPQKNCTSDKSDNLSRSKQASPPANPGGLTQGQRKILRQAMIHTAEKMKHGKLSFWDDDVQELWWVFIGLVEDYFPNEYDSQFCDLLENGKWSISAKETSPLQAGIQINKLINTALSQ
ncbi:hypothetical protein ACIGB6_09970 [Paeniglutamicibacter gangotriensis]|uniref:hypothetical protein n=1 Tax=Paeniglutamicibacter gangotriensis TaxID=254787 RepID=UPI0037CBE303